GSIEIVNTMDGTTLDREAVRAKFGVEPEQITDYLALVGDTSDNIPGVPKVGKKTAAKWLAEYGDLATLKSRAAEITGKVGENLRAHLDQLDLNKQLATIRCDLDLPIGLDGLARRPPDLERVRAIFHALEFGRLLKRFEEKLGTEPAPPRAAETAPIVAYATVLDEAALQSWGERLGAASEAAVYPAAARAGFLNGTPVGHPRAVAPGAAAY